MREVRNFPTSPVGREFKHCNLRPGAQADWGASGSDAAADVQLPAGFFVPSADVGSLKAGEGEVRPSGRFGNTRM